MSFFVSIGTVDESQDDVKELPEPASGRTSYDTDSSIPMCDPLPDSSRSSTGLSILETPTPEQRTSPDGSTIITTPTFLDSTTSLTSNSTNSRLINSTTFEQRSSESAQIDPISASTDSSVTPPSLLPQVLRDVAAMSSLPGFSLPLLEMGFSQRHVVHAMQATGIRQGADTRRINELVTWLLEHPVSEDEVPTYTPVIN